MVRISTVYQANDSDIRTDLNGRIADVDDSGSHEQFDVIKSTLEDRIGDDRTFSSYLTV